MSLYFEWDAKKAKRNLTKHGISFEEASTVFGDPLSLIIEDFLNSINEERYAILGHSRQGRFLVVIYTAWNDKIRIISARTAIKREREIYEKKT